MGLISKIKNFLIYQGPQEYDQFEFLEEEEEGKGTYESIPRAEVKKNHKSRRGVKFSSHSYEKTKSQSKEKSGNTAQVVKNLQTNLDIIKSEFNYPINCDLIIREFKILRQIKAFIVYIDGMVDNTFISNYILRQLMRMPKNTDNIKNSKKHSKEGSKEHSKEHSKKGGIKSIEKDSQKSSKRNSKESSYNDNMVHYILDNIISGDQTTIEYKYKEIIQKVLNGFTALFIDGSKQCIIVESKGFKVREVSTPLSEPVIKGSQEAFVEDLRTNITLVRRIIRNKDLVTEILSIGKINNTQCSLLYMKNIANTRIIDEVKKRLKNINIDFVSSAGALEQLIEDHPYAIFPQVINTERPDRTAAFLMEGKVVIIQDGTPYASIVPITFFHMFHTSEDHFLRWQYGTFLRSIRMIAILIATFLPGLYLALILYHHEMIPSELFTSLAKARENIPFPSFVEIFLMEISWELIREAGVRVPGVIGQTLGIVGGVILGQAAVSAGLVSPALIIIVAIAGLGNFAIPNFSLAFGIRILRFAFLFLGAILGFYGIAIGIFIFSGLACSMKSFGVPYFSSVAPKTKKTSGVVLRKPIWKQSLRPDLLNPKKQAKAGNITRNWKKTRNQERDKRRDESD